jgi:hypothetical protein
MPRRARLLLDGVAMHLIQRRRNRGQTPIKGQSPIKSPGIVRGSCFLLY